MDSPITVRHIIVRIIACLLRCILQRGCALCLRSDDLRNLFARLGMDIFVHTGVYYHKVKILSINLLPEQHILAMKIHWQRV